MSTWEILVLIFGAIGGASGIVTLYHAEAERRKKQAEARKTDAEANKADSEAEQIEASAAKEAALAERERIASTREITLLWQSMAGALEQRVKILEDRDKEKDACIENLESENDQQKKEITRLEGLINNMRGMITHLREGIDILTRQLVKADIDPAWKPPAEWKA